MRVWIDEKPSVGRELAKYLGRGTQRNGYIEFAGTSDVVTWLFGHILQQKTPQMYDPLYNSWSPALLPIVPQRWELFVKAEAKEQFQIIKDLLKQADEIVHAGDPDREGQLLVDELLEYLKNRKPVKRLLLNALDEISINRALGDLRNNADFQPLKNSALARSRADWLIGMNLTRAYTAMARQAGYDEVMRIGRVKTPTMALVVRREREIRAFRPTKHYGIKVNLEQKGKCFSAVWLIPEDFPGCDSDGRILKRELVEGVTHEILQSVKNGEVVRVEDAAKKESAEAPLLPLSLSALQIQAGKLEYTPQQVLDLAQKLYEMKLTTYPRSDCDYLPEAQFKDAKVILENLARAGWQAEVAGGDVRRKSRAWADEKVSAHHAIIPTTLPCDQAKLSKEQQDIYALIACSYLAQFYPPHRFSKTLLRIRIGNYMFQGTGKVVLEQGWRALYKAETDDEKSEEEAVLPDLQNGDAVSLRELNVQEKMTKAPKRFNLSSIIEAMKSIHHFVREETFKAQMKECSGIGTEATRAGILDELVKGGFLRVEKNMLYATDIAEKLFDALPESLAYPDITAIWEDKLARIAKKNFSADAFLDATTDFVKTLLREARGKTISAMEGQILCPVCKKGFLKRRSGKKKGTYFWGCSCYPDCQTRYSDKRGKPDIG